VEWFRGSNSSVNRLSGFVTSETVDDMFNVENTVTLTPDNTDDGVSFICQSSYVGEPRLINSAALVLQLERKYGKLLSICQLK